MSALPIKSPGPYQPQNPDGRCSLTRDRSCGGEPTFGRTAKECPRSIRALLRSRRSRPRDDQPAEGELSARAITFDSVLGLGLTYLRTPDLDLKRADIAATDHEVEALIAGRHKTRAAKDFARSDELHKRLSPNWASSPKTIPAVAPPGNGDDAVARLVKKMPAGSGRLWLRAGPSRPSNATDPSIPNGLIAVRAPANSRLRCHASPIRRRRSCASFSRWALSSTSAWTRSRPSCCCVRY